jgi:hypothetical protein
MTGWKNVEQARQGKMGRIRPDTAIWPPKSDQPWDTAEILKTLHTEFCRYICGPVETLETSLELQAVSVVDMYWVGHIYLAVDAVLESVQDVAPKDSNGRRPSNTRPPKKKRIKMIASPA